VYSNRGSKIDPLADIFRTIPVRAVEKGPAATRTANQKCKKSKTLASSPPGVKIGPKFSRSLQICQKSALKITLKTSIFEKKIFPLQVVLPTPPSQRP